MKQKWIYGSVAIVISGLMLWLLLTRSESPEQVARQVATCIADGDARCVFDRIPEEERLAYGLTEESLQKLLSEYVTPTYAGAIADEGVSSSDSKEATYMISYASKNGSPIRFGVRATITEVGVECPGLVTGLIMSCFSVRYSVPPSGSKFLDKMQLWINATEGDRGKLESIGIKGLFRHRDEGLLSWDKWIWHCQEGINRHSQAKSRI